MKKPATGNEREYQVLLPDGERAKVTSLTAQARNIHCSADERKWPRLRKAVSGSLFNASGVGYS